MILDLMYNKLNEVLLLMLGPHDNQKYITYWYNTSDINEQLQLLHD